MAEPIGPRIRAARFRYGKGMTASELARRIGISRNSMSAIERGLSEPTLEHAKAIADVLAITLDTLIGQETTNNELGLAVRRYLERLTPLLG